MNIEINLDEFKKRQTALIQLMAIDFRHRLEKMGLGEDQELVEGLVFDICAILDGSREAKVGGKQLLPFITFADDRKGENLVSAGGGSWMHEICSDVVEKIYERKPSA
jgi:hypothetical protein